MLHSLLSLSLARVYRRHLLILCFLVSACCARAQTYTGVVVFGDSLSDIGNIAHLTEAQFGVRYPTRNPLLGFNYADGRFTDGPQTSPAASAYLGVWVEQLAAGLPSKLVLKNSLDGGTVYAYGDATTKDGTRTVTEVGISLTLNNMGQQVNDYLATNPTPTAQTLYVLWGGSDDVYLDSTAAAVSAAVAREAALVQRLIAAGASSFLVPNLPPLGGVPAHATDPIAAATLNAASLSFDMQLAASLNAIQASAAAQGKTVTILQPDIFTRFSTGSANPSAVGLFNVTAAAQGVSGNPDTYLIWDGLHPTTTGHHYVAAAAANLITPLTASVSTLSVASSVVAGQTVTLKATVQSSTATPAAPGSVAEGLVTFFNNGTIPIGSATLVPVGGVATATVTLTSVLSTSPYSITAVYAGDTALNISISAPQTLTVMPIPLTPTTTVVTSSALNGNLAAPITFTAAVAASAGTPTGTVTFRDGSTALGSPVTLASGSASLTTSALTAGTHTITAAYSGDTASAASTSAPITQTITAPSVTAALSPASISVTRGASGTSSVTVTSAGGYTGAVTLACGTLPAHLACTFSPSSLSVTGASNSATSTLTVATNASASLLAPHLVGSDPGSGTRMALLLPGLSLLGLATLRRRSLGGRSLGLLSILLLASGSAMFGISGCGGGSSKASTGTYTVPVTATGGTTTATANLTVIVQ